MALWIAMLIVQPFLIKYKKRELHRTLGKVSYVLVPLVLVSSFLVIRSFYHRFIDVLHQKSLLGLNQFNNDEILEKGAIEVAIAIFWLVMLITFYCLAIINRRKSALHARYMLAAALALLGPTVDRIIFFRFKWEKLFDSIPIETAAFVIADMVLALLLWNDYKNNRPIKALRVALLIYLLGQVFYFTVPGSTGWTSLVTFLMKPNS
jgi:uncharacterized membrane protein